MTETERLEIERDCEWIEDRIRELVGKVGVPVWISTRGGINVQWDPLKALASGAVPSNGITFPEKDLYADKDLVKTKLLDRNPDWFTINQQSQKEK